MNINMHIDRLVLDGLPVMRAQAPLIRAALEAELGRRLTIDGLSSELASGGARSSVRAETIQLIEQGTPTQMGRQIARAVYSGIGIERSSLTEKKMTLGIP